MHILNSSNEVKEFITRLENLSKIEKLQVMIPIMEQWSNDQINNKNIANPNIIEDDDLIIFNPTSINRDILYGTRIASIFYLVLKDLGVNLSEVIDYDFD